MPEEDAELEIIRQKMIREIMVRGERMTVDHPVEVNESNFDQFLKEHPKVVVDCWAPWCGPCRAIAPMVEKFAKKYAGDIVFAKLNTDQNPKLAMKYRIMSIPTLMIFKNGKLVGNIIGLRAESALEKNILQSLK